MLHTGMASSRKRQSCPESQISLDTMWKKARPDVDPGLNSEEACSGSERRSADASDSQYQVPHPKRELSTPVC